MLVEAYSSADIYHSQSSYHDDHDHQHCLNHHDSHDIHWSDGEFPHHHHHPQVCSNNSMLERWNMMMITMMMLAMMVTMMITHDSDNDNYMNMTICQVIGTLRALRLCDADSKVF